MGYRYTLVDFNAKNEKYELHCYENDDCVWIDNFDTEIEALAYSDRFLNGEFKEGFELAA